ncbi:unnamed protein product [Closterium sp. NIES-65]|nr:unnamed protein product [Closterium sp. NIES-65]
MEARLRSAAYQQRVRRTVGCVLLLSLISFLLLASFTAKSGAGSGARERILSWLQVSCTSSAPQSASGSRSTEAGESADGGLRGVGGRGDEGLSERHVYGGDGYGGGRRCERVTKAGICVSDFFALVDDVYRPFWPGKVDLVIRSYLSEKLFLLYSLLTSVELMWPRGIGRVVVVLDEGDDVAMHLMPPWVQVKYERNYLKLPGKILQQWSYGWVDNYTSAPFVAIADDDIIFNLKVTPFLLFNLSDPSQGNQSPVGRPYLIGSKDQGYHRPSTDFLLGRRAYAGNFMVQLPLLLPRGAVSGYRDAVGAAHPKMAGGYDEAVQWWAEHGGQYRDQIAHTVMGNYLWNNDKDKMEFAMEWSDHTPIPRVGIEFAMEWVDHTPIPRVGVHPPHTHRPLQRPQGWNSQWSGATTRPSREWACICPTHTDLFKDLGGGRRGGLRSDLTPIPPPCPSLPPFSSQMEFAMEWTDHTPIPRVGVHLPYTNLFKDLGGSPVDPGSKLNLSFVQTAAHYQKETICHSLPPGKVVRLLLPPLVHPT